MSRPRLVLKDSETAGDIEARAGGTGKKRSDGGSESNTKTHRRTKFSLDCENPGLVGTPQSTEVRDMIIELGSKRPCKQEKPSNARIEGANFSRGERGGGESSASVLNCRAGGCLLLGGRARDRGPGFFSMSPQQYRSSEAQVHVSTTSVI